MMALKGRWGAPVGDAGGEPVMTLLYDIWPQTQFWAKGSTCQQENGQVRYGGQGMEAEQGISGGIGQLLSVAEFRVDGWEIDLFVGRNFWDFWILFEFCLNLRSRAMLAAGDNRRIWTVPFSKEGRGIGEEECVSEVGRAGESIRTTDERPREGGTIERNTGESRV